MGVYPAGYAFYTASLAFLLPLYALGLYLGTKHSHLLGFRTYILAGSALSTAALFICTALHLPTSVTDVPGYCVMFSFIVGVLYMIEYLAGEDTRKKKKVGGRGRQAG